MKKHKLTVSIPSAEELLAGLDLRQIHPGLAVAERAGAAAERALAEARASFARHEQDIARLPAQIRGGQAPQRDLAAALLGRDQVASMLPELERALADARGRVPLEAKVARKRLADEVARRREALQRAADEVSPILAQLAELSTALDDSLGSRQERAFDPSRRPAGPALSWPMSPEDREEALRKRALAGQTNHSAAMAAIKAGR